MPTEVEQPHSFWLDTVDLRAARSLDESFDVDVAVVGGGFTGLATALELRRARPDLSVAVLEAHVIGYGASGRNGGFAMTLFGLAQETTVMRFGKQKTAEAFAYMRQAVDNVCRVVEEEGIDCDLEKTGLLVVANSPAQAKRLRKEVEHAAGMGIDTLEYWDRDRVIEAVSSPYYCAAKHDPDCALLNPLKLALGLRDAAERHGAEVYEMAPVRKLTRRADAVHLETPGGTVRAGKVVLATNAYSAFMRALNRRSMPVFTYIVTTEPLTDAQLEPIGWKGRQGIEDARNLVHYYRLTADNRLLMGGGAVTYHLGGRADSPRLFENASIKTDLERFVQGLFPSLEGVGFSHHWGGPVSVPLDMAPAIGRLDKDGRVLYSLGCVGHGVALATMNGRILRDLVLGDDTELSRLFFVDRFVVPAPPEPIRFAVAHTIRGGLVAQDKWQERRLGPRS